MITYNNYPLQTFITFDVNYHLHVLGFGTQEQVNEIKSLIIETDAESKASVSYEEILSDEEYSNFIHKCHIGLSTQNSGSYSNALFPSKIFSYI